MSAYTEKQAEQKARQIFDRFGVKIRNACSTSAVPDGFLAGFVGVEAGIDRNGIISETATRFEPGVYQDLISLRDHGYCVVAGKKRNNYSGVAREQVRELENTAVRNLATSFGMTQIMGWHCLNNLKCTIDELRDPDRHLTFTIKLLGIVAHEYLTRGDLASVLHIWNTGSAGGKTYHEAYVENALKVKKHYDAILHQNPSLNPTAATSALPTVDPPKTQPQTDDKTANQAATLQPPDLDRGSAETGGGETGTAAGESAVEIGQTASQFFWTKLMGIVGGLFTGAYVIPKFDLSESQLSLVRLILPYLVIGAIIALCWHYWVKKTNNFKLTELVAKINSDPARKDIRIVEKK